MKLRYVSFRVAIITCAMVCQGSSAAIPTPDDYLVRGLDEIEPAFGPYDGAMYAGLVPTTLYSSDTSNTKQKEYKDGSLMFWLYAPTNPTHADTLVIWLNGGPGCSSFGGSMFENGPVTIGRYPAGYYGIDPEEPFQYNPYAWTNATAIMYVEQPHGTGFSTGPIPNDETDVSRDFYHFLQNLLTIFDGSKHDWRTMQLYFFGESYAGMFVPSIAHYIYEQNVEQKHRQIHLAGIALGNGWMDAQVQGPAVIDYAWWHGMIDTSTVKAMKNEWKNCKDGAGHQPDPFHTFTIPDECGIMDAVLHAAGKGVVDWGAPNAYDVTTWDPYLMLDYPNGAINQFYNNPRVQKALNLPHETVWVECIPGAGRRRSRQLSKMRLPGQLLLDDDRPTSTVPYVADLLDNAGIRVLIYNGDRDMTTNSQGSELLLDGMSWSGASGWADIDKFERGVWLPNDEKKLGGYIKRYLNLDFLVVYNSGHLVPFNQDEISLDLVTRYLGNVSFLDKPLPKFQVHRKNHHVDVVNKKESDVSRYQSGNNFIGDVISSVVFVVVGFAVGFLVARRYQKGRGLYQAIPGN